ncbi:unnamed protein product, partial [Sphagnum troendelagicum]
MVCCLSLWSLCHLKTACNFDVTASFNDLPVHQLWPPPEDKRWTRMDVIFFHGLQFAGDGSTDAWRSTWTQKGCDDVCWAKEWLPFDLGKDVRILSVSYNAHVITSPHDDVSEIAHNLFEALIKRCEWDCPIVLIGHSFGGLVLKSLVVKAKKMSSIRYAEDDLTRAAVDHAKAFLNNVRGVVFYAVPHAGSYNITEYVNKLLRSNNKHHARIMENVQPCRRDMEELSEEFEKFLKEKKVNVYAFGEGKPMNVEILVHFSSAQRLAGSNSYKVEDANHMEVCKPTSQDHISYTLLLGFIKEVSRENNYEALYLSPATFGLKSYVERVEKLLTSAGSNASPCYVGVWGMGGVGKTLLLREVYWSRKVRSHFQGATFIWLTVGQTPDMLSLYRSISDDMGSKPHKHSNMVDYKQKLESELVQKRVFLVLDDVWKDEHFDALDLGKGEGSVTLLTTRIQSILQRPCISQEHMKPLSPEDSWSLFCVHAFGTSSSVPHRLEASAKSMAEECKGLPLALKVIGAAMFGKTSDEREWKPLLKKLKESRLQERTMKNKLYERLKLGYDVLKEDDPRLDDCFTYFAAFPEEHEVEFEVLLWCWIGEGLVPGHVGDDPEIDAYDLLMKLRRRSLIESIAYLERERELRDLGKWTLQDFFERWNLRKRVQEFDKGWLKTLDEDLDEQSDGERDEESDEELDGESDEDLHEDLDEDWDEGLLPGYVGDDPEIDADELSMKLGRRSLIELTEKLDANLDDVWEERQLNRELLNEKLHEGFHETLDEDLDEQSDGELDEESDEELDGASDEDLHDALDEDLLDEDLDEESDEKFDEEVFRQYKVHDVMRDLAFYILQIDGGTTPAQQLALYQAGQNLTEFPPRWITECKQPLKAHRLSLYQNQLETLPSTFCAPELLTLLLGKNMISDVPAGFLKGIQNLRVLDLCFGKIQYLPEELGNLKDLVYLNLSNNYYLQELPESIENLRMLRNLTLSYCFDLRYLPSGELGNLKDLVYLNLSNNYYLQELPESIENLRMLRNLTLSYCFYLRYLPSGVVALESLQVLDTKGCTQLRWAQHIHTELVPWHTVMAESFSHEAEAKGVSLENISRFKVLTHLRIEGDKCQHVLLPDNISALTKLEDLRLYHFRNLETLP